MIILESQCTILIYNIYYIYINGYVDVNKLCFAEDTIILIREKLLIK